MARLEELVRAHSTPGDEGEVRNLLVQSWERGGLCVSQHGQYAVSAALAREAGDNRPVALVCAHMDSPGFTVDAIFPEKIRLVPLGGAHFDADSAVGRLKTGRGEMPVEIHQERADERSRPSYFASTDCDWIAHGDRVCFTAEPEFCDDGMIRSPFLDNRLGCWALCRLAEKLGTLISDFHVILGATACEEIGGFGAPVLARAVVPDLVVCLDATYEDETQGVLIGQGPVLTLSDASVIISPAERDRWLTVFNSAGVPLQTEVYNYSGTDSRAFPHAGLPAPVYALLAPTRGNHTPMEEGSLKDLDNLVRGVEVILANDECRTRNFE